jgi:hypothetical protein
MKLLLIKDPSLQTFLQEKLGDDYIVLVTREIEEAIELYEI